MSVCARGRRLPSFVLSLVIVLLGWTGVRAEPRLVVDTVAGASFGEITTVDLLVSGVDGDVIGWLVDLEYDPMRLDVLDVETDGTVSNGCSAFWNGEFQDGVLRIATACTFPIGGDGVLVRVSVTPTGTFPDGTTIPLVVRRAQVNEVITIDDTQDGAVIIGDVTSVDGPVTSASFVDVYPNPARAGSVITWSLGASASSVRAGDAWVEVFDLRGRRLTGALTALPDEGGWSVSWLADTPRGPLASGVYLYRVTMPGAAHHGRLTIVQ